MPALARDIVAYFLAVIRHWVSLLGCAVVVLYQTLSQHLPGDVKTAWWKKPMPPWLNLLLLGCGVLVAGFLAWRDMRTERDKDRSALESLASRRALAVLPSVQDLPGVWRDADVNELFAPKRSRQFAVLRLRNTGTRELRDLVVECFKEDSGETVRCIWSREPGEEFVLGGSYKTNLSVGESTMLVIARAKKSKKTWLELPLKAPLREIPLYARVDDKDVYVAQSNGEIIWNIGKQPTLAMHFRCEGLDQTVHVRLGFDRDAGPTILVLPSYES